MIRKKTILYVLMGLITLPGAPLHASWSSYIQEYIDTSANVLFPPKSKKATLHKLLETSVNCHENQEDLFAFYSNRTHEFLGYLGCKNVEQIPVCRMTEKDSQYNLELTVAGYTDGYQIVIRTDDTHDRYHRLFVCAREAVHYALNHHRDTRPVKEQAIEADITAARMLCANGYRWVVKMLIKELTMEQMCYDNSSKFAIRLKEQCAYLKAILNETKEDCTKMEQIVARWSQEFNYPALTAYVKEQRLPVVKHTKKNKTNHSCSVPALLISSINYYQDQGDLYHFYRNRIHEFLGYLGCKNPQMVPIEVMASNHQYKGKTGACCQTNAIILDKEKFAFTQNNFIYWLFGCAHESAHHILNHARSHRPSLEIEKEADITAARMLCANGYRWVVNQFVANLSYTVYTGYEHNDGVHPSNKEQYAYLSAILNETEENGHKLAQVAVQWSQELKNTELIAYVQQERLLQTQPTSDRTPDTELTIIVDNDNKPWAFRKKAAVVAVGIGIGFSVAYLTQPRVSHI